MAAPPPVRASAAWLVAAAVATVAFAAIAVVLVRGHAAAFDLPVTIAIQRHGSPGLDAVARVVTNLGSWQVCIAASAAVAAWAASRRDVRAAVVMALAYLTAEMVNQLLKVAFARDRPALLEKIPLPDSYSFPSGHAMSTMVTYGVIAAIAIRYLPRSRAIVVTAAALVILATGLSRVYLGVHWPLDVLAGFCGGVPLLAVAHHAIRPAPPRRRGGPPPADVLDGKPAA